MSADMEKTTKDRMEHADGFLLKQAEKARENAYAPYSHFTVGAALLAADGKIYLGCNVENAAFAPTICAERTAFCKAVSEGQRDFVKIAIAGGAEGERASRMCPPCGVCRQVMREFCVPERFEVLLADGTDEGRSFTLAELLPFSFGEKPEC